MVSENVLTIANTSIGTDIKDQFIVVCLDESCHDRHYSRNETQNGSISSHISDTSISGILSKDDIDILLTMFNSVVTTPSPSTCLHLLTPKSSASVPPPTILLIPLPQSVLSSTTTSSSDNQNSLHSSEESPRSSNSHEKHPQSDSSETSPPYGPEFLRHLNEASPHGIVHIVPVALCRKGEAWDEENLATLLGFGIRNILNIPCDSSSVGGLYMHLQNRISKSLADAVSLQRYKKSRVAPQPRHDVFSSWMQNNTIIDLVVQSYAPQPNLIRRPVSLEEFLPQISSSHLASLAEKVNDWDFHAGRFSMEDLIWSSVLILEHVLATGGPDLARYHATRDELVLFMLTVRSCYQPTNHYHNFRHAIDVLQATFQVLVMSNIIPPLNSTTRSADVEPLLPEGYLTPLEVLALCIAAVGHDAAHPGVTNAFLAASGSSLSTIFNDRSVLENLHCLTISRIIQERWPTLFDDEDGAFRKLIIEMILSTDMALHFDFMARFEALRGSIITDPIDEKQRRLICCCLMKSADISNLARPLQISTDWTFNLQKEIGAQEDLMISLNITPSFPLSPTTTRGQPPTAEQQEQNLAKSQLGFITTFAEPLWTIGADLFYPGMKHGLTIIRANRQIWMDKASPLPARTKNTPADGADSSISTVTTATGKSEGTVPTPRSPPVGEAVGGSEILGPRKVASTSSLNGETRRRGRLRKERSLSSLWFWKKRGRAGQSEAQ